MSFSSKPEGRRPSRGACAVLFQVREPLSLRPLNLVKHGRNSLYWLRLCIKRNLMRNLETPSLAELAPKAAIGHTLQSDYTTELKQLVYMPGKAES